MANENENDVETNNQENDNQENEKDVEAQGADTEDPENGNEEPEEGVEPELDDDGYLVSDVPEVQKIIGVLKAGKVSSIEAGQIFKDAVDTRNPDKINTIALTKLVGADKAQYIKDIFELYVEKSANASTKAAEECDRLAGGRLAEIKEKVVPQLSAKEKAEYNALLAKGGVSRELAINALLARLDGKAKPINIADRGGRVAPSNKDGQYISAKDYQAERKKLVNQYGYITDFDKAKELDDRRRFSIAYEMKYGK